MTNIESIHAGVPAVATRRPLLGPTGVRGFNILVRISVALWFVLQATNLVREIVSTIIPVAHWFDPLDAARLLSRACLFLFFTMIAWLTLVRQQPLAQAPGWRPRVTALLGTYLLYALPFFPERDLGIAPHLAAAALIVTGNVLALAILLRLGRSFSIMAEARRLVTDGPYAIIRHPLYLAEQIAILGAFIEYFSFPAAALVAAQFAFQVQRMCNEEAVLTRSFPDYAAYRLRTARLIPGIW